MHQTLLFVYAIIMHYVFIKHMLYNIIYIYIYIYIYI